MDKPVWSIDAGRVLYVLGEYDGDHRSPYGNRVYLTYDDGNIGLYAHLAPRSFRVKVGQAVEAGTELGLMGMSGLGCDNEHLHLGEYPKGAPQLVSSWAIDPTSRIQRGIMPTVTKACNPWGSPACSPLVLSQGLYHEGIDFSGLDENVIEGERPAKGLTVDELYLDRLATVDPQYVLNRAETVRKNLAALNTRA
jgi:hypothetical protein